MASFAKPIAFFFFILVSSSFHVQARESKFFSKFIHLGAKISPLESPAVAPALAPTPAPAPAMSPTDIGSQDPYYGLYGHGSGMFPPANEGVTTSNTPTTTSTFKNDLFAEELADERYESGYEKNNNGYTMSNYDNNNNYKDNGYTLNNYEHNTDAYNGYETERQGMSDTRFVEGGKYYYNVKRVNYYPNGYEFSSSKETNKNEGYYGNTENSNEFNSMEELENREDEYQERQEEYAP
ncbi:hypothetical protein V6N13_107877 [Hibiscus sabdariffa]|uniref:Protein E6-like n=1 Tax=Hibiscus sabdariffa TaxID=183260 RepID=A0ABR2SR71_9ROSI